ncbi:MAG: dTDP-4-dehydrorhamnose reductase [Rhodospirillales bacterium]
MPSVHRASPAAAPVDRRALVFGRSGQVAREIAARAARSGWTVVAVGRPDGDLRDTAAIDRMLDATPCTVVVNAAADTDVDGAESDPGRAFAVNADGAANLAAACARHGLPLVHVSTDYVFDGRLVGRGYREDDPVGPLGAYARSKAEGEAAVRDLCPRHAIVRSAWLYSPHGRNFVRTMIRLAGERDEVRVVDDQVGNPTAAADLADMLLRVADHITADADLSGTWHYAGSGAVSWHGFARAIFDTMAQARMRVPRLVPIPTVAYPSPTPRPANSRLDCGRAAGTFGITAPPWRASLSACLDALGVSARPERLTVGSD